jgi:UDP-N-acetyl-alpha-D-muramoyl-L-alanyl-L-glutamate epimerase
MAARAKQGLGAFDPAAFASFRFRARELDAGGTVALSYALDDELSFTERLTLPVPAPLDDEAIAAAQGLLALLHWVAGVSYFKAALPREIAFDGVAPGPAAARLLEALYSEGLGELAYANRLPALPRPCFAGARDENQPASAPDHTTTPEPRRALVAVGGGKDSAVAIEVLRRSGVETALFSIGDPAPIARTVAAAELPRLLATRELDPLLFECNAAGAINGHVPVTAIVTCVALLTAALNGFDTVAMANERSASAGNMRWDGVEINHQFSKGLAAERLLASAVAETGAPVRQLSVLRPASELAIARAFAGMERYHGAFTSCNAIFRIEEARRGSSWCLDCPKCRFVFLAMAPFSAPGHLAAVFGADLLADEAQFGGFALLAASGGHKPFECVGEEQESIAAMRMLAEDPRWREHAVVRRLAAEVLPRHPLPEGDPAAALALSDEHDLPPGLLDDLRAVLGA